MNVLHFASAVWGRWLVPNKRKNFALFAVLMELMQLWRTCWAQPCFILSVIDLYIDKFWSVL